MARLRHKFWLVPPALSKPASGREPHAEAKILAAGAGRVKRRFTSAVVGGQDMDAGDLKVFEAVARLGGMNRAAVELNTVQSNVTGRIRALEDELGTSLFERH